MDLANKTNGVLGSICDASYSNSLNFIQQKIVELTTQFKLSGLPNPQTIAVTINGTSLIQDPTNGWTYDSVSNSISFHESGIPGASANIQIHFDPATFL